DGEVVNAPLILGPINGGRLSITLDHHGSPGEQRARAEDFVVGLQSGLVVPLSLRGQRAVAAAAHAGLLIVAVGAALALLAGRLVLAVGASLALLAGALALLALFAVRRWPVEWLGTRPSFTVVAGAPPWRRLGVSLLALPILAVLPLVPLPGVDRFGFAALLA